MKNSLPANIKKYSEKHPDAIAVLNASGSITYSELYKSVKGFSLHLKKDGISEGINVVVISENSVEFIVGLLSLWMIGAVPVPINCRLTKSEIEIILNDCSPEFILVSKNVINEYKNYKTIPLILNNDYYVEEYPEEFQFEENNSAVIIYTSGTTGSSKGVVLSHKNLLESAKASVNFLNQTIKDRWLASLPFYHIGGFMIFYRALFAGSSLIITSTQKNDELLQAINNFKPTLISLVSTQLKRFADNFVKPNNNLKYVLLGGGPLDDTVISAAINLGWNIVKVYGSTETTAFVTAVDCKKNIDKASSVGKALTNSIIKIVDENDSILPSYTEGEIAVSSSSIMKGYWKRKNDTSAKIRNGFYYSGDYGYLDDENYLYIKSRRTDLIICGGENINPVEIENYLLSHPAIEEVCIIGIKDEEWGEIPAAVISLNEKMSITVEETEYFLKDKISSIKFPKKIFLTDELPKTSLGKIKREELKRKFN